MNDLTRLHLDMQDAMKAAMGSCHLHGVLTGIDMAQTLLRRAREQICLGQVEDQILTAFIDALADMRGQVVKHGA